MGNIEISGVLRQGLPNPNIWLEGGGEEEEEEDRDKSI